VHIGQALADAGRIIDAEFVQLGVRDSGVATRCAVTRTSGSAFSDWSCANAGAQITLATAASKVGRKFAPRFDMITPSAQLFIYFFIVLQNVACKNQESNSS
jgi:hypothetical protein